jgi:hypothetical protein
MTAYLDLTTFKATSTLTGFTFADADATSALESASRTIDELCSPKPYGGIRRRFYADADALQVRYYTPLSRRSIVIDDLITITSLKTDPSGQGAFDVTWTLNTDFNLTPLNAAADGRPFERIVVHPRGYYWFPIEYPRSVQVTGKFGWATTPQAIIEATGLLAARILKRKREAPLGIVGSHDGIAMQIARTDPDIPLLIKPFMRGGRGLG